jgi:hypothetical protein
VKDISEKNDLSISNPELKKEMIKTLTNIKEVQYILNSQKHIHPTRPKKETVTTVNPDF